jgi:3D (Asp-Asp-Asp) domain-containing protein
MKSLLYTIIISCFLAGGAHGASVEKTVLARVTAYWRSEGCGLRAYWNGTRLHGGHCAVDPKRIPFGSHVVFPDTACVAVDTGPDVVNRKAARLEGRTASQRAAIVIDRFFETKREAMTWLESHPHFMNVRVLPPGQRPAPAASTTSGPSNKGSIAQATVPLLPRVSPFACSIVVD